MAGCVCPVHFLVQIRPSQCESLSCRDTDATVLNPVLQVIDFWQINNVMLCLAHEVFHYTFPQLLFTIGWQLVICQGVKNSMRSSKRQAEPVPHRTGWPVIISRTHRSLILLTFFLQVFMLPCDSLICRLVQKQKHRCDADFSCLCISIKMSQKGMMMALSKLPLR